MMQQSLARSQVNVPRRDNRDYFIDQQANTARRP